MLAPLQLIAMQALKRQLLVVASLKEMGSDDAFSLLAKQSKSWLLSGTVKEAIKLALKNRT